ncbi:MAG: hypothetical protein M1824_004294, partial [Vezdaea acicularis]
MVPAKRQKLSDSVQGRRLVKESGIRAFGRISKAHAVPAKLEKEPPLLQTNAVVARKYLAGNTARVDKDGKSIGQEKILVEEEVQNELDTRRRKVPARQISPLDPQTSKSPISQQDLPDPIPAASNQSSPRTLLRSEHCIDKSNLNAGLVQGDAKPSSTTLLPEPLLDLIDLHSAFLTSLSLHVAHHGCITPPDLRLLKPTIERSWGKRAVSLDDIKKILGVLQASIHESLEKLGPMLSLLDYGRNTVCIDISEDHVKRGVAARLIDEEALNSLFTEHLEYLWRRRDRSVLLGACEGQEEAKSSPLDREVSAFIDTLPNAPVKLCSSVVKAAPLLAKGQRRLEEFRCGMILKKETTQEKEIKTAKREEHLSSRRQGFFERLKAKKLQQSKLPAPLSPKVLARKSAAQRVEEVANVLTMLGSTGSKLLDVDTINTQRVSLPMMSILQHLQNSLRNPISEEEGTECMRILANEIAPEWVTIVTMGK